MLEKIQETQAELKELGYFASEGLSKIVTLFKSAGDRSDKKIPSLYLEGESGVGKTFLAKKFAEMIGAEELFVQCFPRMGTENFHKDIDADTLIDKTVNGGLNAEIIVKAVEFYAKSIGKEDEFYKIFNIDKDKPINEEDLRDKREVIQMGILLKAIEHSKQGPVVLTIDELDKSRPEVDYFLLDFLENGRLSTGTEVYEKGSYPIYTVITSNNKREIDEALFSRSRRVKVPRPTKDVFLEILGLPENHYLGWIYDKCPEFSIRQAKQYIEDLEILGAEIDEDALSQYVNLDKLDVASLADVQYVSEMENGDLEFELSNLARCYIPIYSKNEQEWIKLFEDGHKSKFTLHSDEYEQGKLYVDIDTIEQLQIVSQYMEFDYNHNQYDGWFEYSLSDEEMESDNIVWAGNKNKEDGTRFGIKIDEDKMFKIAMNKGNTFVYLNSDSPNTLEAFLGQQKDEIEQEYETDSEYGDEGRDYDD